MTTQIKCQKCGTTKPPIYYHITDYATLSYTRLCKQCHDQEHGLGLQLTEIFEEYTPIVEGGSQYGRYKASFIIQKRPNPKHITEQDLKKHLANLKNRYPNEGFYLRKTTWRNRKLHVLAKKKKPHVKGRIPIYFDLTNQKFYVEKKDLEKQPKLTNYIIMVTLGSLGVSQSRYARSG